MSDLVSVCIPTYNGAKYLVESLDCVVNQTYRNLEILIVDDQSTDDSLSIAREFGENDARVRIIKNEKNLGLVGNWNRCIDEAKGDWVKLHFQDDLMHPDTVKKMIDAARQFEVRFVLADRDYFFEGKINGYYARLNRLSDYYHETTLINPEECANIFDKLGITDNFFGEPILGLVHQSMFGLYGGYDETLQQIVDLEFWLRLAVSENFVFMPERFHSFRIHKESQGARNDRKRGVNPTHIDRILIIKKVQRDKVYSRYREFRGTNFIDQQISNFVTQYVKKYGYKRMKSILDNEAFSYFQSSAWNRTVASIADFKARIVGFRFFS